MLEQGIPAVKYNYSNDHYRRVVIRLSHKRSKITYETPEASQRTLLSKLKGNSTSINLDEFIGIIYGG